MDGIDPAWAWICAGIALGAAEILRPGYALVWAGLAALIAGALALGMDINVAVQLGVFAGVTLLCALAARLWRRRRAAAEADPTAGLINRIAIVVEPVDAEQGKVQLADDFWHARGDPAQVGDKVRIVAIEEAWLVVTRRRRGGGQKRRNR